MSRATTTAHGGMVGTWAWQSVATIGSPTTQAMPGCHHTVVGRLSRKMGAGDLIRRRSCRLGGSPGQRMGRLPPPSRRQQEVVKSSPMSRARPTKSFPHWTSPACEACSPRVGLGWQPTSGISSPCCIWNDWPNWSPSAAGSHDTRRTGWCNLAPRWMACRSPGPSVVGNTGKRHCRAGRMVVWSSSLSGCLGALTLIDYASKRVRLSSCPEAIL
mmetsp:Transcript_39099/g.125715  ORF Transcript_39099/g.125715 Transcript_39099/m.125715 type:complete len:215 (-) Transcript_39099:3678-4322(-)